MLSNLRIAMAFICFGITSFVFFTPVHTAGKIAVGIMAIIFIAVGILYFWVFIQENKK